MESAEITQEYYPEIIPFDVYKREARSDKIQIKEMIPEDCRDDFTRCLIEGIPLPDKPTISSYLIKLSKAANKAASLSKCEYNAELGTDGNGFKTTPLVKHNKDSVVNLSWFAYKAEPGEFRKVVKFHSHPQDKKQKYAGFSIGDLEDLICYSWGIINVVATSTDIYVATSYPEIYPKEKLATEGETDEFADVREWTELDDQNWSDEEREQKIAKILKMYNFRYFKYSLQDPSKITILV